MFILTELFSFAAGLGTGIGGMIALNTMRRAETQPIPAKWLPAETPMVPGQKPTERLARSPYAPKPRGQEPYIPKPGKPIPNSIRARALLPDIPWGTK